MMINPHEKKTVKLVNQPIKKLVANDFQGIFMNYKSLSSAELAGLEIWDTQVGGAPQMTWSTLHNYIPSG